MESAESAQQGDPLGALLFCNTIQSLVKKLKSKFCVLHLDDGTVGGYANDVLHDLQLVEEEVCRLGLHLNHEKTELICDDPNVGNHMLPVSSDHSVVLHNQATLLRTSLACTDSFHSAISSKVEKLKLMREWLCHLSRQDFRFLLWHSLTAPKLNYLLQTAPWYMYQSQLLVVFHEVLRSILSLVFYAELDQ